MPCFTKNQREKWEALYKESEGKECLFGWIRPDAEQMQVLYESGGGGEGEIIATGDELIALFGYPRLGEYKVAFSWDIIKEGHAEMEEIREHDKEWDGGLWQRFKRLFKKPLWDSMKTTRRFKPYISIYDWKATSCYASRLPSPLSFLRKTNISYNLCALQKSTNVWMPLSYSQQQDFKKNGWEMESIDGYQWSVGSNFKGASTIIQSMLNTYREGYEAPPLLNYPHTKIKIPQYQGQKI